MEYAELVLDYIRALVWPALAVFVAIRFRGGIGEFLGRVAGESQEISATGFGHGITAKFVPPHRVRYRAVEALLAAPVLISLFENELRRLARTERNRQVHRMARRALERMA